MKRVYALVRITVLAALVQWSWSASQVRAQAVFVEDFEDLGATPSGQHGPSELTGRRWEFRNQSDPVGFGNWDRSAWAYQGRWALYVDFSVGQWRDNRSEASSWAVLPAVTGQTAGHELRFFTYSTPFPSFNPTAHLEVRYSPSGQTRTGSGPSDVGDFTVLLADLPDLEEPWTERRVALPGGGRIAFRFHIAPTATQLLFSGDFTIDTLSVGPPGPACNLPPIPTAGQTVTWTAAQSPYRICENQTIPAGGTVNVEPGVVLNVDANRTLTVAGTMNVQGTVGAHISFNATAVFPPMVTVRQGTLQGGFVDFGGQLRVETAATVDLADCGFAGHGVLLAQELQPVAPFIRLRRCAFESSQLSISDAIVVLENNAFNDSYALVLRGQADMTAPNTFTGKPLEFIRESHVQPAFLDGIQVTGVPNRAGLVLSGGDYLLGSNVVVQNSQYPIELFGGLLPGSHVPTTGNTINAIDVGGGGAGGFVHWSDFGIPYRLTAPFGTGGRVTIAPGVTVEAADPDARPVWGSTVRLVAEGLPEAPITFKAASPGGSWRGLLFQTNSGSGPRLEHVVIRDARLGVVSSDNTMFADSCLFENNQVGANANTYGSIFIRKSRFVANSVGVSTTDLGHPDLDGQTNPNAFEGNGAAVDAFEFGSEALAIYNWWNHSTGPLHPNNPGGQGDPIVGPGAFGVFYRPWRTARPDFSNTPPVVRMVEPGSRWSAAPHFFLDPGTRFIVRWDARDDGAIVRQRILFSPDGHYPDRFTVVADDLPPGARSYEWTVPNPGFAVTYQPQFLKVVAIDDAGQEGWDQTPLTVSSGRITGELTITSNLTGQTFTGGQAIPDMTWTGSVSMFPNVTPMIVLENDGSTISGIHTGGRGVFFSGFPHMSTDKARLALRVNNNSNDVVWFFADGYFSIRHDPRLGLVPPAVDLTGPAPGSSFAAGTVVPLAWTAAATHGLHSFDVLASYDAGRTWHQVAVELPSSAREFAWRLPPGDGVAEVRVRVVARDMRFQNNSDDGSFTVTPGSGGRPGDLNCDGVVDAADVGPFALALVDPAAYVSQFPGCNLLNADLNGDGNVNGADTGAFIQCVIGGCP